MDHDDEKKYTPEIDKKLYEIIDPFEFEYGNMFGKQSESSSRRGSRVINGDSSPNRNRSSKRAGRPKTNCVETKSKLPDHQIRGFENEILYLKSFLLKQKESEGFKALAVVGKFGVGKTALCQVVFNDVKVKEAYLPRIWVSMYISKPNEEEEEEKDPKVVVVKRKMDVVKRILLSLGVEDEMLKCIEAKAVDEKKEKLERGEKDEEMDEEKKLSGLLDALNSNLNGKKYLIVLDDVWEDNGWDQRLDDEKSQLSCGFPKGFGGRVIVTSREEKLGKKMVGGEEEENVMRLFPRSDAESVWEIYRDAAEKEVKPRYPVTFKKKLMDKSCGVPWAARMLAMVEPVKVEETGGDVERKKSF